MGVKFYFEKLNETGLMKYRSKKNIRINLKQIQLKMRSSGGLLWTQLLTSGSMKDQELETD